jgi:hypothetical protein
MECRSLGVGSPFRRAEHNATCVFPLVIADAIVFDARCFQLQRGGEPMAKTVPMKYRAQGDAVLERMKNQAVPASMKGPLKSFQQVHARYLAAAAAVDDAHVARDSALQAVADADSVLDDSLGLLAQKASGAGMGTRQSPLSAFTRYSVSALTELAYKKEADVVVALGAKIAKASAPKEVGNAASACVKNAKTVLDKLRAVVKPQGLYSKALSARDQLLPDWTKAYSKLKKFAAAAWYDEPATYQAVFAPVDAIQAPKARRSQKKPPPQPAVEAHPRAAAGGLSGFAG